MNCPWVEVNRHMSITDHSVGRHSLEEALQTLLSVEEHDTGNHGLRGKLLSLEEKLNSNQLYLAVLGQMKRGKSSFINALLGADVLPTGVLPVTAIITEIRYGRDAEAAILYTTGLREGIAVRALADYITEAGNPGNKKQVASVEITYPSDFLKGGIVLIDTPGIGSTHSHNTRTTESYLEQVDAGIVVLSVDPPITEVESRFIKTVGNDVPKLFFVLNKIDVATGDESSHISRFLEGELNRLQIESPEIFLLSARKGLERKRKPSNSPDSSGMENFETRLRMFLVEEKGQVLVHSVAMDVLHAADTLRFAVAIGVRAQAMSSDELDRKRLALDRLLEQTGEEVQELQVLLRHHSGDIVGLVEHDLTAQVQSAVPLLRQHLQVFGVQHPKETGRRFGALLEAFLMTEVETVFQNWRLREDEKVQARLDTLSARFVVQANSILERLQQAASSLFEVPVEHVAFACPLRVESHLYYRVERVFYSLDSFLLLLPRFLLRPAVLGRMRAEVASLLDTNAGRIRYDYMERLQSSMTQFGKDLTAAITMVAESLRAAVHRSSDTSEQTISILDSVIKDCFALLARGVSAKDETL